MTKFFAFLLAGVSFCSYALAQEPAAQTPAVEQAQEAKPATPHFSPLMPVKIKPRQGGADSISKAAADIEQENAVDPDSLGLLTKISEGSLGDNLWQGYTSETLAADLESLDADVKSATLRSLLKRALLTKPVSGIFPEDKSGSAAFSARMATLIELGQYDAVLQLYKKLEGNIPSSEAALAGTQAMVSNGQMGLACLEEKAISSDLKTGKDNGFWVDLAAFCQVLLTSSSEGSASDANALKASSQAYLIGRKISAPSSLSDLNNKSTLEIVTLENAKSLSKNLFTLDAAHDLKPDVIALLLKQKPASPEEKLALVAAGVEKNLLPLSDLQAEYSVQAKAVNASAATSLPEPWKEILNTVAKLQGSASQNDQATALKPLLKNSDGAVLLPFAANFAALNNLDAFSPEDARKVIGLLIESQNYVPGRWAAKAFGKPELDKTESLTDFALVQELEKQVSETSSYENDKKSHNKSKNGENGKSYEKAKLNLEKAQLDAISLILGPEEVEDKTRQKFYDNVFNLTASDDYVMPSKELMNNLSKAAKAQDIGKVIIYSLQMTEGRRVSNLHPAGLYRIMESLQSAGLSEEVRSLAHEVLVDLLKK